MTSFNTRRTASEQYDPKQRIVGGIVLFLIMLLIYIILKLLLGMSTMPDGSYKLPEPLPAEVMKEISGKNSSTIESPLTKQVSLPLKFVFLDIHGNPMQKESYEKSNDDEEEIDDAEAYVAEGDKTWFVQAASFRERSRAVNLVEKLKVHQLESTIIRKGRWYAVQLLPTSQAQAEKQLEKLRSDLDIKGMLKEIK